MDYYKNLIADFNVILQDGSTAQYSVRLVAVADPDAPYKETVLESPGVVIESAGAPLDMLIAPMRTSTITAHFMLEYVYADYIKDQMCTAGEMYRIELFDNMQGVSLFCGIVGPGYVETAYGERTCTLTVTAQDPLGFLKNVALEDIGRGIINTGCESAYYIISLLTERLLSSVCPNTYLDVQLDDTAVLDHTYIPVMSLYSEANRRKSIYTLLEELLQSLGLILYYDYTFDLMVVRDANQVYIDNNVLELGETLGVEAGATLQTLPAGGLLRLLPDNTAREILLIHHYRDVIRQSPLATHGSNDEYAMMYKTDAVTYANTLNQSLPYKYTVPVIQPTVPYGQGSTRQNRQTPHPIFVRLKLPPQTQKLSISLPLRIVYPTLKQQVEEGREQDHTLYMPMGLFAGHAPAEGSTTYRYPFWSVPEDGDTFCYDYGVIQAPDCDTAVEKKVQKGSLVWGKAVGNGCSSPYCFASDMYTAFENVTIPPADQVPLSTYATCSLRDALSDVGAQMTMEVSLPTRAAYELYRYRCTKKGETPLPYPEEVCLVFEPQTLFWPDESYGKKDEYRRWVIQESEIHLGIPAVKPTYRSDYKPTEVLECRSTNAYNTNKNGVQPPELSLKYISENPNAVNLPYLSEGMLYRDKSLLTPLYTTGVYLSERIAQAYYRYYRSPLHLFTARARIDGIMQYAAPQMAHVFLPSGQRNIYGMVNGIRIELPSGDTEFTVVDLGQTPPAPDQVLYE